MRFPHWLGRFLWAKWLLLKILLKMVPAGVFTDWQEGACTTTGAHWINLRTLLTNFTQIHSLSVFMLSFFQICWWVAASNNLNHLALQGRLCFSDAWLKSPHEQWYEMECNTITHYIQPLLALLASPYSSLWVCTLVNLLFWFLWMWFSALILDPPYIWWWVHGSDAASFFH